MDKRFQNFFKVYLNALTEASQLLIIVTAVTLGLVFSELSVVLTSLGLGTVFVRGLVLSSNPDFIQKSLENQSPVANFRSELRQSIKLLERKMRQRLFHEVRADLRKTLTSLRRFQESWHRLNFDQQKQLSFLSETIPDLIDNILKLSEQEQLARTFLKKKKWSLELEREMSFLQNNLKKVNDKIAIQEYEKAIELKKQQMETLTLLESKIHRIDSYIFRIQGELDNTNLYINQLVLQDKQVEMPIFDNFNQNLKQLTQDINSFEEEMYKLNQESFLTNSK